MSAVIDLTCKRFGRLTAIERAPDIICGNRKLVAWVCRCDCGKQKIVTRTSLTGGLTQSCGCLHSEMLIKRNIKHGDTRRGVKHFRLYGVWSNMKNRCYNPKIDCYKNYGGRGITVCNEWLNGYELFKEWAMKNGYDPSAETAECTIDRIDNDGPYAPWNCRFVTYASQARNKRPRKTLTIGQYQKDGSLITTWPGSLEISESLGYDRANISRVCTGKRDCAYGYNWRYI